MAAASDEKSVSRPYFAVLIGSPERPTAESRGRTACSVCSRGKPAFGGILPVALFMAAFSLLPPVHSASSIERAFGRLDPFAESSGNVRSLRILAIASGDRRRAGIRSLRRPRTPSVSSAIRRFRVRRRGNLIPLDFRGAALVSRQPPPDLRWISSRWADHPPGPRASRRLHVTGWAGGFVYARVYVPTAFIMTDKLPSSGSQDELPTTLPEKQTGYRTQPNRRPHQCRCHGPTFLMISIRPCAFQDACKQPISAYSCFLVVSCRRHLVAIWWRFGGDLRRNALDGQANQAASRKPQASS